MAIAELNGDIFTSRADALVNTCNCYGAMGKGIALAFREKFPDMYLKYRALCKRTGNGTLKPGMVWPYKTPGYWVLNYMVKDHWRNPSQLDWVNNCLRLTAERYKQLGITSIAMPQIAAHNGQLDWPDVLQRIYYYLGDLPIDIEVYTFNENTR